MALLSAGLCDVPGADRVCSAPGQIVGAAVGQIAGSAWDGIVSSFTSGVVDVLKVLMTFWMQVPGPGNALSQANGPTAFLRASTSWYVTALAVGSVLIAAAKIALTQRSEPGGDLAKSLVRVVFAIGVGVPAIQICLLAGDGYSQWILTQSTGADLPVRLTTLWTISSTGTGGLSSGLLLIMAVVMLLASLTQMVLMVIRTGVVILLTGMWPLSASMSNTEAGYRWWQRSNAWLAAFVLFKPAAATVYATGFAVLGTGQDVATFVSGIALLGLAVLTLPALMRLAVPAVASASAGGSGGVAAAAGGAIATGAMLTGRMAGSGGGSGGRPSSGAGPTGSAAGPSSPGQSEPGGGPSPAPGGSGSASPGSASQPTASHGGGATATTVAGPASAGPASTGSAATGSAATGAAGSAAGSAAGPAGAVAGAAVSGVSTATGAIKTAGHEAMGDGA